MLKKILILLLLISVAPDTHGQTVGTNSSFGAISYFTPSTPEMSGFQKYGDLPVDYNTGIPDIKVPLGQISLKDFSWPVFLSYHAGGNKVEEFASCVGLGWELQAAGFISTKSFGESSNVINHALNLTTIGDHNFGTDCSSALYNNEDDVMAATYAVQTGDLFNPDINYISTPVFNAKFIDYVTVPVSDMKIALTNAGLIVVDGKGNVYTFGAGLTSSTGGTCSTYPFGVGSTNTLALTKIKTYKGDSLLFNYTTINYNYTGIPTERRQYQITGQCERCEAVIPVTLPECNNIHNINEFVLSSIVASNGQKVVFDYSSRTDNTALKALNYVSFYETVNGSYQLTYKHQLQQDYFGQSSDNNLRLKLETVQKQATGLPSETYSFTYNSTALPAINSRAIDVGGYYTGTGATSSLPSLSDRTPNLTYVSASVLTGITYPTGGHTQFTYELNTGRMSGLRILKIIDQDSNNATTKQRTYSYVGGDAMTSFTPLFQRVDYQYYLGNYPTGYHNTDGRLDDDVLIPCALTFEQSMPIVSNASQWLGNTNVVNYDQVTEFTDDYTQTGTQGNFGKTVYYYNNHVNDNSRYYLLPGSALLTEKDIYKKDGSGFTMVKSEEYDYLVTEDDVHNTVAATESAYWEHPTNPKENRTWITDIQMLHDCILQPGDILVNYTWPKEFVATQYYIDNVPYYLSKTIVKDYLASGTVTTENDYSYDISHGTLAPTEIDGTDGNGKNYKDEMKYTNSDLSTLGYSTSNLSAVTQALNDNLISPVWKRNSVNTVPVFEDQLYLNVINNKVLTVAEVTKPTGGTSIKRLDILQYDIKNNPLQITTNNLSTTSYRYDSNNQLTASCTECSLTDFAFTSFNDQVGSGFSYSNTGVTTSDSYASGSSYNISTGGNITVTGFTQSGSYIIAGFIKGTGPLTVTGATAVSYTQVAAAKNGWHYFEQKVTPTTGTVSIGGTALVDELRFYPAIKSVKSFAYGSYFNTVTATTDEKGITAFYEYDNYYRLINIRDQYGNLLKHTDYHYQGQ